ncbi:hypothetical protein GCM10022252_36710 [Streptosporangium oxazolinicum]|uniref:Uncharacterized protein n=1 Tax=Streptosporangium oxazolinicum TaxID=909287 RepID=A0ABP8AYD2_9ACTN
MSSWDYYQAKSENGRLIDDPSEDAIYIMLGELRFPDNTFLVIEQPEHNSSWYVVISVLDPDGYEVEFKDGVRGIHRLFSEVDQGVVVKEVTIWLAQAYRFHSA